MTTKKSVIYNRFWQLTIFIGSIIALSACIKGKGPIITETRTVSGFTGVSNECSVNIHVKQDSFYNVVVEGQKNIIDLLQTKLDGSVLVVNYKPNAPINTSETVDVYVTAPNYESFKVSGSGDIVTESLITADMMSLKVSGSGGITSENMKVITLDTKISGSGNINLKGIGNTTNHTLSGSGSIGAIDFATENTDATISGSGNMEVRVSHVLNAKISGSGNIQYKGSPTVNVDISGSGSIKKLD